MAYGIFPSSKSCITSNLYGCSIKQKKTKDSNLGITKLAIAVQGSKATGMHALVSTFTFSIVHIRIILDHLSNVLHN
jgi:hypothetical protein